MRTLRASLILSACLASSCTEPNPNADDDGASSGSTEDGSGTGGDTSESSGGDSGSDGGGTSSSTGDDTTGTGDTTGTTTDGTTSALACTGECVDGVPAGWQGPVAIGTLSGDTAPGCGGEYPTEAFAAYDTLTVPGGSCDCSCGDPQGTTCPAEVDVSYGNADNSCQDVIVTAVGPTCKVISPVDVSTNNRYWRVVDVTASGGACTPTLVPDLGTPSWDAAYSGCEGELAEGACADADDLCVTPPSEPLSDEFCIWQAGDVECPPGDYGDKILLHGGFTDTRDCEDCLCGDPTGTCTEPEVRMHAQDTCACVTTNCDFGTACMETPFSTVVYGLELRTAPTVDTADCAPSDPQVTGSASADEPRTLCCTA